MESQTIIALTGIGGLVGLELYALYLGVDGTALAGVIAAISGIAGYELHAAKVKKSDEWIQTPKKEDEG